MKLLTLCCAAVLIAGCASPLQGIRVRAQAPSIDEAYRKISLAASTDGYQIESVDPTKYTLQTQWRDVTAIEQADADRGVPKGSMQSRITLRLDRRGMLYDVQLTPSLRYKNADGSWNEVTAGVRHPLWVKWEKVIGTLLQKEMKEED
jgi:hypothetical protein